MSSFLLIPEHTVFSIVVLFFMLSIKFFLLGLDFAYVPFLFFVLSLCVYYFRFSPRLSKLAILCIVSISLGVISAVFCVFEGVDDFEVVWKQFCGDSCIVKLRNGKYVAVDKEPDIGDIVDIHGSIVREGNFLLNMFPNLRFSAYERCMRNLEYPVSSLVASVLFGVREDLPVSVKTYMLLNGTYHYLAISGLHIGVIISLVYLLLKKVIGLKKYLFTCSSLVSLLFLPFTGFPASALRAFLFSFLISFGRDMGRKVDALYITVIISIFFSLFSQFGVGSLLSFLSVCGIILSIRVFGGFYSTVAVVMSPFLFTLPFVVFKFGVFNAASFLNSVLLFPIFYVFLFACILSGVLVFSVDFFNDVVFHVARLVVFISRLQYDLTSSAVIHVKVGLVVVLLIYVIAFFLTLMGRYKFAMFVFLVFFGIGVLNDKCVTCRSFYIDGKTLNSPRFITINGSMFSNCVIQSDYILPFTRKILVKNKLIDLRGKTSPSKEN